VADSASEANFVSAKFHWKGLSTSAAKAATGTSFVLCCFMRATLAEPSVEAMAQE